MKLSTRGDRQVPFQYLRSSSIVQLLPTRVDSVSMFGRTTKRTQVFAPTAKLTRCPGRERDREDHLAHTAVMYECGKNKYQHHHHISSHHITSHHQYHHLHASLRARTKTAKRAYAPNGKPACSFLDYICRTGTKQGASPTYG